MDHERIEDERVRVEEGRVEVPEADRAASGAPAKGWAIGDRFSWPEIQQRLIASADEEIAHSPVAHFFSGVTAGFAITLTFLGYAVGLAEFPDNAFAAALLYPIGFMYIILGRYELYTENTLPPVKLVLTRLASLPLLLRFWLVVLVANLVGSALGAFLLSRTQVLSGEAAEAARALLTHSLELGWWDLFFKGFFTGWLVAGAVWLGAAARDTISRFFIVYLVFYATAVLELHHVVAASCELFFVMFGGQLGAEPLWTFLTPVGLGNTAGGVVAFTLVAYVQSEQTRYPEIRVLSLREILFSLKGGRPFETPRPNPPWTDGGR